MSFQVTVPEISTTSFEVPLVYSKVNSTTLSFGEGDLATLCYTSNGKTYGTLLRIVKDCQCPGNRKRHIHQGATPSKEVHIPHHLQERLVYPDMVVKPVKARSSLSITKVMKMWEREVKPKECYTTEKGSISLGPYALKLHALGIMGMHEVCHSLFQYPNDDSPPLNDRNLLEDFLIAHLISQIWQEVDLYVGEGKRPSYRLRISNDIMPLILLLLPLTPSRKLYLFDYVNVEKSIREGKVASVRSIRGRVDVNYLHTMMIKNREVLLPLVSIYSAFQNAFEKARQIKFQDFTKLDEVLVLDREKGIEEKVQCPPFSYSNYLEDYLSCAETGEREKYLTFRENFVELGKQVSPGKTLEVNF